MQASFFVSPAQENRVLFFQHVFSRCDISKIILINRIILKSIHRIYKKNNKITKLWKISMKPTGANLQYTAGVPKATDTFQPFIIKKLDNLRIFFSYH